MAEGDGRSRSPPSKADKDNRSKEQRTSRACLNCRARKSACHLPVVDGIVTTPCERCKASGAECVIGSSNRGGRRVRKRTATNAGLDAHSDSRHATGNLDITSLKTSNSRPSDDARDRTETPSRSAWLTGQYGDDSGLAPRELSPSSGIMIDPALQVSSDNAEDMTGRGYSSNSNNIAFNDLQNPSDALGILAQIADQGERTQSFNAPLTVGNYGQSQLDYALIRDGRLSMSKIIELLQIYKHYYHPFFPLVPSATLEASNLPTTARDEQHLLTAVLVIASRDLRDEPHVFMACSEYMRTLVSALAAGGPGNVEAVEALLVLAEWTPYTSRSDAGHVGRGEEDREAWMHVGTALRIGYFLGLDRYSFHVRGDDAKDPQWQRKRLVWAACYISDRQISIRLGRAFWSRGPGPLTTLSKADFPMLAPTSPGEEDYASIFQATLELTLLFSNVHDVLYSNPGNSMRNHLAGGYIKYIDDFRSAIYGWKSVWGTLTCSPHLKATLLMSYDYLRLYTNAFAFHATVKRALPQGQQGQETPKSNHAAPGRVFYNNVGAVGDARFIYEGLDAAKSLLSMVNTFVDPEKSLRFMPLRYYLYAIYSGVFLYRARCVGVLASDEEQSVRRMIKETVSRLERSGIGTQHPGSRYAQLLKLLWEKVERKERRSFKPSTASLHNPYRPNSMGGAGASSGRRPSSSAASAAITPNSPSTTEVMGDFSWTDLDAIGNFAVNGNGGLINDAEWWSGFLPADSGNFLFDATQGMDDWNLAGLQ
ncbi:transcription factor C6 like protein [Zymoseptoria brevis]|uniref:Transcription factor C6 like protein n=1 Tax=Zymoseptoria brevis TaxID=1047168 RepID=A0A0F4GZ09_9PEZI|nr:transcription factor C6 like protein [Zymoseptoria brevis]